MLGNLRIKTNTTLKHVLLTCYLLLSEPDFAAHGAHNDWTIRRRQAYKMLGVQGFRKRLEKFRGHIDLERTEKKPIN